MREHAVQVKGGRKFGAVDLREVGELLNRRGTVIVGIVVRGNLSQGQQEAVQRAGAEAGSVRVGGREYQRLQVITESEVLGGRKFRTQERLSRGPARRNQVELQREEAAQRLDRI